MKFHMETLTFKTYNTDLICPHVRPSIQQHFLILPLERGSEYNTAYRQIPAVPQWFCLSATVLWNIVDIPAAACISPTSTAAYDTHKCHWCHFPWLHSGCDSWIAHSLSLECQHNTHYELTSRSLTSSIKSGKTSDIRGGGGRYVGSDFD